MNSVKSSSIDPLIFDKLTPEEKNSISNLIPILEHATALKLKGRIPPQAYSEEQIQKCTPEQLQQFFEFFELPENLRNVRGIVQILRFLDFLNPSSFRDIFTYSYSKQDDGESSANYFSGKLLKPIENLPAGMEYDVLGISAEFFIWPKGSKDDFEHVSLYL